MRTRPTKHFAFCSRCRSSCVVWHVPGHMTIYVDETGFHFGRWQRVAVRLDAPMIPPGFPALGIGCPTSRAAGTTGECSDHHPSLDRLETICRLSTYLRGYYYQDPTLIFDPDGFCDQNRCRLFKRLKFSPSSKASFDREEGVMFSIPRARRWPDLRVWVRQAVGQTNRYCIIPPREPPSHSYHDTRVAVEKCCKKSSPICRRRSAVHRNNIPPALRNRNASQTQ